MEDDDVAKLYAWIDDIPLSRPKKSLPRDFSDGGEWLLLATSIHNIHSAVLVAEVVHYFLPKIVDLHNYTPANALKQKQSNWGTLNRRMLCFLTLTKLS